MPSLAWEGSLVGLRVEFAALDGLALLARFQEARNKARANVLPGHNGEVDYLPPPRTLSEYLSENIQSEFGLRYYVLDMARFDSSFSADPAYVPLELTADNGRTGKDVLNSLVRVDVLHAQRHLSDSAGGNRAEDLSRCLSRFYERNLEKRGDDFDAMRALALSEAMLNDHLARVFDPLLSRLGDLGYPGLTNPRLLIKTALNPATIMSSYDGARVHYALGDPQEAAEGPTLPDRYNGLGFKNLIYMVVELLNAHTQWIDIEENRPPLHLVFIEEPEAHLHAQLQQVFIRKVLDILSIEGPDQGYYSSQLVVTTHSPHILYERGFRPIRYFRRSSTPTGQTSEVLNLSSFYNQTANPTRDFLERYLRLTHCDLFFADAAVLVEGNVERLLLPIMIEKAAPRLKSSYLTILEIGGAFGYRFRSLIEFLGITALVVTDIDSVKGIPPAAGYNNVNPVEGLEDDAEDDEVNVSSACMVNEPGAVTSNQTLIQWLPAKTTIADLLETQQESRIQPRTEQCQALVCVTYQTQINVTWKDERAILAGRTLEEAFALENLSWCQAKERADLKLRVRGQGHLSLQQMAERLHNKIKSPAFKKTDFALALLAQDPNAWAVPSYIAEGLQWLQDEVRPVLPLPELAEEQA